MSKKAGKTKEKQKKNSALVLKEFLAYAVSAYLFKIRCYLGA